MALFEAPAVNHEHSYSQPYSASELENEWEVASHEHPYSQPYSASELENEWEVASHEHPYSQPYSAENEWEAASHEHPYSQPYSAENEWEVASHEHPYSQPYSAENEWEVASHEHPYSHPYSASELEYEGEFSFKKAFRGLKRFAKIVAPFAVKALTSIVPGGAILAPFAGKLTSTLLREGEMEAAQMEAEFFGTNEAEAEVANTEVAHEAALTEFLAAQAAEASTEAEAQSHIGATLPLTITIAGGMRGRSVVRPVMPALSQATGILAKSLIQQGPKGRQLLRLVPTIQRRTMTTLKALSRSGQPINSATAVKAMAAATQRVLSNPNLVQKAIDRNVVLRQRTASPTTQRRTTTAHRCPTCATPVRTLRR
jgi:hypothetical protein